MFTCPHVDEDWRDARYVFSSMSLAYCVVCLHLLCDWLPSQLSRHHQPGSLTRAAPSASVWAAPAMSGCCKFCRLERSSPNPSKHMDGTTLPMVSARDAICKPCRGTQTASYAGVSRTSLAKTLENPGKFSEYMKARDQWLRLHNEAAAAMKAARLIK